MDDRGLPPTWTHRTPGSKATQLRSKVSLEGVAILTYEAHLDLGVDRKIDSRVDHLPNITLIHPAALARERYSPTIACDLSSLPGCDPEGTDGRGRGCTGSFALGAQIRGGGPAA